MKILEKLNVKVTRIKKLEDEKITSEYIHINISDSWANSLTLSITEAEEVFKQLKEKLNK